MERILLYNVSDCADIIKAASNMRISYGLVRDSDADMTIGELAKSVPIQHLNDYGVIGATDKGTEKESLLIFCDVTEKHMDKILFEIRRRGIKVTFKAVLTPTNSKWNIRRMLMEMRREQLEYMRMNMK